MDINGNDNQFVHTTERFNAFLWLTCHLCSHKFLNKEDLREHVIIDHPQKARLPPRPKSCELCSATFPDNLRLFRHQDSAHLGTMKNAVRMEFVCCVCSQQFVDLTSFEEHSTHERHTLWISSEISVSRYFCCRFCDRKFSDFPLLKSHQRIQHRVVPHEAENGKLLYNSKKANRRGRLDFFSARPRGRPPKVRIEDQSSLRCDEEEASTMAEIEASSDQVNVTTVEDEIDGFGCPYCSYFGEDYNVVAQHTTDHYQAILARQQPENVIDRDKNEESESIELNSEVINFMGKDRSFLDPDLDEWVED
uniref:C2H2-type domain-containing protein n=1 Tax=Steinernema glaseri TaxID=37863 RepID=A0A1I8ABE8_9BILA